MSDFIQINEEFKAFGLGYMNNLLDSFINGLNELKIDQNSVKTSKSLVMNAFRMVAAVRMLEKVESIEIVKKRLKKERD